MIAFIVILVDRRFSLKIVTIFLKFLNNIPTPHHITPCNQNLNIMKYGVNRVTLVGNVGEVPRVSEKEGEAFVANRSSIKPIRLNGEYKNRSRFGASFQSSYKKVKAEQKP